MSTVGFQSFSPALRRFLVATVVNLIGGAAMFSFVLIYFHEVRGLPLGQAGVAVAATSFVVVAGTPFAGALVDRFGARRMLTLGCLVSITAASLHAVVGTFAGALAASALLGVGNALWFPSQSALLALITTPAERPALSAFHRASINLGAALGGVVGGFIVASGTLAAFRWLFALNVATYLVFLAVLPGMPAPRVARSTGPGRQPGMRTVLRDRFFVELLATDVAIGLGFGYLFAFMPAYASKLGVSTTVIGAVFMVGAAVVVLSQLPTLRWASGRPRMRSLALMNLWFAVAFALMTATPYLGVGVAVLVIAIGQALGGLGESLLGAVRQPLTSDLAPPELVGRYFGLATMVFQGSMGLATALGGVTMQRSIDAVWVLPLVVSTLGVLGSLLLGRRIPAAVAVNP